MGLNKKSIIFIEEMLHIDGRNLKGLNICEMGHLELRPQGREYLRSKGVKSFWLLKSYLQL